MTTTEDIIKHFNLKPHPEGGYANLLYEDPDILDESTLPPGYIGSRAVWNAIYYLLPKDSKCVFHRIRMSEMWNFYLGGPLELYDISPEGKLTKCILGHELEKGQQVAYIFPKGHWIGATPSMGSSFSFVSCVTAPGFKFSDWEVGSKTFLSQKHPHLINIINKLT